MTNKNKMRFLVFSLMLIFFAFSPKVIQAANVCVDDSSDGVASPGDCDALCTDGSANCSLRDAIAAASANDHIIFAAALSGQTINLTGSALTITTDLSIDGPGAAHLTISGQDAVPIFDVQAQVGISGLSMTHGRSTVSGGCVVNTGSLTLDGVDIGHCEINANSIQAGIGIFNDNGAELTISNTTIHNNQPTPGATGVITGGGISNLGTLQIDHSTIRNNTAVGVGGIESVTGLTLNEVTVADNTVTGGASSIGGGIFLSEVDAIGQFTNVTISGNQITGGGGKGGGLAITAQANATLTNVTIGNNSVTGPSSLGGGVWVSNAAQATMTNVTIVENSATNGGNLYLQFANPSTIKNVILANATSGGDCGFDNATLTNDGGNLVEDGSCGFAAGGDPNLGPLQNNGGDTLTYALLHPSPAIDSGNDAGCPATDQRGVTRPQGPHCDIGAVEFIPTVESTTEDLTDVVSELPTDAFQNSNMISTLLAKIDALKGAGNGTKNKLINDILSKGDGCPDAADSNDWINDCDAQAQFQAAVQAILDLLDAP